MSIGFLEVATRFDAAGKRRDPGGVGRGVIEREKHGVTAVAAMRRAEDNGVGIIGDHKGR